MLRRRFSFVWCFALRRLGLGVFGEFRRARRLLFVDRRVHLLCALRLLFIFDGLLGGARTASLRTQPLFDLVKSPERLARASIEVVVALTRLAVLFGPLSAQLDIVRHCL